MKRLCTAIALLCALNAAQAQLPDGSVAPNFSGLDLNGEYHELYSWLDENYVVYLDVMATWCGPCLIYKSTGAMESFYEVYGPDSLERAMVFMIEGDSATPDSALYGVGPWSIADWVTGTPFPIFSDPTAATVFDISYWPTLYKVCPWGNVIKEIPQLPYADLVDELNQYDCKRPTDDADVWLIYEQGDTFCEPPDQVEVRIINMGIDPLTSATIYLDADFSNITTYNWTGNLGTYEEDTVYLDASSLEVIPVSFELSATVVGDADLTNNDTSVYLYQRAHIGNNSLTFDLQTDDWGSETTWNLATEDGTVLYSGGPYPDSLPMLYSTAITLPGYGCYRLTVDDSYGDGLTVYGGYFQLTEPDGNILVVDSDFGYQAVYDFAYYCNGNRPVGGLASFVGASTVDLSWDPVPNSVGCRLQGRPLGAPGLASRTIIGPEVSSYSIPMSILSPGIYEWTSTCACSISPLITTFPTGFDAFVVPEPRLQDPVSVILHPNPASSQVYVELMATESEAAYRVYNAMGKLMDKGRVSSDEPEAISVSKWAEGIYFIQIMGEDINEVTTFEVIR